MTQKQKITNLVELLLEANSNGSKLGMNITPLSDSHTSICVFDTANNCKAVGEHIYLDANMGELVYSYKLDVLIKTVEKLCQNT